MLRTALLVMVVGLAAVVALADDEELNRGWLATDVAIAEKVRQFLPGPATLKDFVARLPGDVDDDPDEHRDIGFGGKLVSVALHGGYSSCRFHLLVVDGEIADLRVIHDIDDEDQPAEVGSALAKAWGKVARRAPHGMIFERKSEKLLAQHRERVAKVLGARVPVEVPKEKRDAYELLTDPMQYSDFGKVCYYAGVPPSGREAIAKFDAKKDSAIIRNILRGANAPGRMYAAEALIRLEREGTKMTPEDAKTIAEIAKLDIMISCCHGCMISDSKPAELIAMFRRSRKED